MNVINWGTLPTLSFLTVALTGKTDVPPRDVLNVMSAVLKRHGPTEGLRTLLEACGFTWGPEPKVSDLDLDVAAVATALSSAAPPSDSRHGAVEPEPGAAPRRERQTAPGTTGGAAGVFHDAPMRSRRRESRAHRIERAFFGDVLGED